MYLSDRNQNLNGLTENVPMTFKKISNVDSSFHVCQNIPMSKYTYEKRKGKIPEKEKKCRFFPKLHITQESTTIELNNILTIVCCAYHKNSNLKPNFWFIKTQIILHTGGGAIFKQG